MSLKSLHLTILPTKLNIGAIPQAHVQLFTHPLINFLLFSRNFDEDFFLSLSTTKDELSLVVGQPCMNELQQFAKQHHLEEHLQIWPQTWVALRTDMGSTNFDTGLIATSLVHPLAQAGITLFYLSTYSSDYCLVEEKTIGRAIQVLKSHFEVIIEGGESLLSNFKFSESTVDDNAVDADKPPEKRTLYLHNTPLYLAHMNYSDLPHFVQYLIHCFFYSNSTAITSYIEAEQEISMILAKPRLQSIPPSLLDRLSLYSESWRVFSLGDQPLGYSESGIVDSIATPLSTQTSSIFYLSTFRTDYCLILQSDKERAVTVLKDIFAIQEL